jgi:hypothetical protein
MTSWTIRERVSRWRILAIIGLGVLALTVTGNVISWADDGDGIGTRAISSTGVKTLRPAATGPSAEDNLQRQFPPPPRPGDLQPSTPAQMEQYCLQNPRCGQKLNQARQGLRPSVPLSPANAPSLEDNFLKLVPPPGQRIPLPGPRSHIPNPVERFFSWLNPFTVDSAWAQAPFSVTLTPDNRYVQSPPVGLGLVGGYMMGPVPFFWMHNAYSTNQSNAENKPYVYLYATLPAAGFYLIDMVASPSLTKLRHIADPISETWDYRAGCGGLSTCHHVSVEYYAAGNHFWYFWADPTVLYTYFYSVTIKSYP